MNYYDTNIATNMEPERERERERERDKNIEKLHRKIAKLEAIVNRTPPARARIKG